MFLARTTNRFLPQCCTSNQNTTSKKAALRVFLSSPGVHQYGTTQNQIMLTNIVLRGIKTTSNRKTATIKAGIKNQMIQDKYKRTVIRRVIRPRPKQPKTKPAWISGTLPKILTPQNIAPKQTKPLPDIKPIIQSSGITKKDKAQKVGSDLWKWLKENSGIIILNLGSLCTLTAFTRSDMLELRCLSMTGSISSVLYFLSLPPPKVWFPAMWSSIFAFTNAYKVYFILEERKGKPKYLSSEELAVYEEYFAPHGMTPRQFEKLIEISTEIKVPKGQVLVENETDLNSVYLVKSGSIDALTGLKRRVTAASTDKSVAMTGGDSGAWIGELAFLDYLAARDTHKTSKIPLKSSSNVSGKKAKDDSSVSSSSSSSSCSSGGSRLQQSNIEGTSTTPDQVSNSSNIHSHKDTTTTTTTTTTTNVGGDHHGRVATKKAIFTYVATEDATVYSFDHDALRELLESSVELRAALTRAMTAAVVGKVVNMYLSKLDKDKPLWQKWLEDNWQTTTTAAASTVKEVAPVDPQQEISTSTGSTNTSTNDTNSVPLITIKLLKKVQEGP